MGEVDTVAQDLVKKDPNSFDGHRILAALAFVNARQNYSTGQAEAGKTSLKTAIAEFRKADAAKPGQTPIKMSLAEALVARPRIPGSGKDLPRAHHQGQGAQPAVSPALPDFHCPESHPGCRERPETCGHE